jgi:hypothetical protein
MSLVIRAIDVGYSWTKYIEGDRVDGIRRAFPSVAPRQAADLALDGLTQRQTVQIAIDGSSSRSARMRRSFRTSSRHCRTTIGTSIRRSTWRSFEAHCA